MQSLNHTLGAEATLVAKPPTRPMYEEAVKAGFYTDSFGNKYLKTQILTIEEIFNGKKLDTPQKVPIYKFNTKGKEIKKGEQEMLS